MPWKESPVMDQRIAFLIEASRPQANLSALCREFGISRRTGYKWLGRLANAGTVMGLAEQSRHPHHSPGQTPTEIEAAVVALRKQYGWGGRKLAVLLARQGIHLPEVTVNRILRRRDLIGPQQAHPQATGRFCRPEPNQLWQMDFKGEYRTGEGEVYPLVVLDDHSRYLLGLWPLPGLGAELTKASLVRLFEGVGVPQAMLLDHGVPWWGNSGAYGLTRTSVWLMRQGIELCFSGIGHPQTQGKVERQNRTFKARTGWRGVPTDAADWAVWAGQYRAEYNWVRPHEALELRTPGEVWRPVNLRPYQPDPPAWDYGTANVRQIDRMGALAWGGRRFFVSEALVGEWVRVDELAGLVLVTFCNTTLREIDLATGASRPVKLSRKVN